MMIFMRQLEMEKLGKYLKTKPSNVLIKTKEEERKRVFSDTFN